MVSTILLCLLLRVCQYSHISHYIAGWLLLCFCILLLNQHLLEVNGFLHDHLALIQQPHIILHCRLLLLLCFCIYRIYPAAEPTPT
jgi:hypothetical protein